MNSRFMGSLLQGVDPHDSIPEMPPLASLRAPGLECLVAA